MKKFLAMAMLFAGSVIAYGDSLTVTIATQSRNIDFAPRHVLAIWITNSQDQFVKSLKVCANFPNFGRFLYNWIASTPDEDRTDAITSASLNNHQTHTVVWNCTNVSGSIVPNGNYKVNVEFSESNGAGVMSSYGFTKGSASQNLAPADVPYFTGVHINFGTSGPPDTQAPSAPTDLSASNIGATSCNLSWIASTDNVGVYEYDIYKNGTTLLGTTASNTMVVSGLTSSSQNSITVKARDGSANTSAASAALLVTTPACTLPSGWIGADISSAAAGQSCQDAGTYTINGSGADIWGTSDQFRFTYKSMSGDGSIAAKVLSVQNTDANAKAGVMIRENLTAGSKHAICYVSPSNVLPFQIRSTSDSVTTHVAAATGISVPYWVKLQRVGDSFSAYQSVDGSTWTQVGTSQRVSMGTSVLIGLAVTSHTATTMCTSQIGSVAITGNATATLQNRRVASAVHLSSSPALYDIRGRSFRQNALLLKRHDQLQGVQVLVAASVNGTHNKILIVNK